MPPPALPYVRKTPTLPQLVVFIGLWLANSFQLLIAWILQFRRLGKDALGVTDIIEPQGKLIRPLFEILDSRLPKYTFKPKTTPTHVSSPENKTYAEYRILATRSYEVKRAPARAQEFFDYMMNTVDGPYTLWPHSHLVTEADVNDHVYRDWLEVCECAVNHALKGWYEDKQITGPVPVVRALSNQLFEGLDRDDEYTGSIKVYPDHTFCVLDEERTPLVSVEEKRPPTVDISALEQFHGRGKRIDESGSEDMAKHLAQLVKYLQRTNCDYSVLTSTISSIACEWSRGDPASNGEEVNLQYWDMDCEMIGLEKQKRGARLSTLWLLSLALDKGKFLGP